MEEKKTMEIEVNAFQLVVTKPIPEPGTVVEVARNQVVSLMPSPTFIIESSGYAEQILRGFVHSGYEVSIKEVKVKKIVPAREYEEKCCEDCAPIRAGRLTPLSDDNMESCDPR